MSRTPSISGTQDPKVKLTARELFYSAVQAAKPAQSQERAKRAAKQAPATGTGFARKNSGPPTPASAQPSGPNRSDGGRVFTGALTTANAGVSLGLKYAILMGATEVPVDTVFHAGDRIQLNVQTNIPGYPYIISRGSSGTWKPLFPSLELDDGNNRVEGFRSYLLPPKSRLIFDEQTGPEKLFIVFSREPEPNLGKINLLAQGRGARFCTQACDAQIRRA